MSACAMMPTLSRGCQQLPVSLVTTTSPSWQLSGRSVWLGNPLSAMHYIEILYHIERVKLGIIQIDDVLEPGHWHKAANVMWGPTALHTWRSDQNGPYVWGDIFKCIFLGAFVIYWLKLEKCGLFDHVCLTKMFWAHDLGSPCPCYRQRQVGERAQKRHWNRKGDRWDPLLRDQLYDGSSNLKPMP